VGRRIKVLHILWSGEIGGTEEYIITLLKHFDYSRYEIYLCFLSRKGLILEEATKLNNVKVAFIGIKNGYDIIGAFKFAKYLTKERFGIIHSHTRNFLSTAILTFFAYRVPKILTHHVGPVDSRLFKKEKVFYKLFSRIFLKITAISNTVKENLINDLGIRQPDKIEVIYNGIDLKKFNSSCSIPSDLCHIKNLKKYIFGFIGRFVYFKRPRLFIEVAAELLKKDKKFFFIMVGDGPELEKCKKMINQMNECLNDAFETYFPRLGPLKMVIYKILSRSLSFGFRFRAKLLEGKLLVNERIVEDPQVFRWIKDDGVILDIGCYSSRLPIQLASLGYRVYGVDIRPYPFKHPNFQFYKADIFEWSPREKFDVVLLISVLEHFGIGDDGSLVFPEADKKAVERISGWLSRDAQLIVTVPFGNAGVTKIHRIYDIERLKYLFSRFRWVNEIYFKRFEDGWLPCSVEQLKDVSSPGMPPNGVALLNLEYKG